MACCAACSRGWLGSARGGVRAVPVPHARVWTYVWVVGGARARSSSCATLPCTAASCCSPQPALFTRVARSRRSVPPPLPPLPPLVGLLQRLQRMRALPMRWLDAGTVAEWAVVMLAAEAVVVVLLASVVAVWRRGRAGAFLARE